MKKRVPGKVQVRFKAPGGRPHVPISGPCYLEDVDEIDIYLPDGRKVSVNGYGWFTYDPKNKATSV